MLAEIPLLFETGKQEAFDRVIVAACVPELQLQRLMRRDKLAESEARARLAAQWPIADKRARATDVVDTSGTFAEIDHRVDALCALIDGRARLSAPR